MLPIRRPVYAPLLVLFSMLVLAPAAAQAQGGASAQMSYEALMGAPVGSWAEYEMSMNKRPEKLKVRYAIVARSAQQLTVEVDSQTPMGTMVMHMEFVPEGARAWKLKRAVMQMGSSAPREIPTRPGQTPMIKKGDDLGKLVGKEKVKTRAGEMACKHYRKATPQGTVEMWVSDKVLPIGMVKLLDPRGAEAIYAAGGTGATAKIK